MALCGWWDAVVVCRLSCRETSEHELEQRIEGRVVSIGGTGKGERRAGVRQFHLSAALVHPVYVFMREEIVCDDSGDLVVKVVTDMPYRLIKQDVEE